MAYEIIAGPESKNTLLKNSVTRTAGGALARGAEITLGAPGDILSFLLSITSEPLGGLSYADIQNESGYLTLPTSAQIKEHVTTPLTGTSLEPQSATEENLQDLGGTFLSLMVPWLGGMKAGAAIKAAGAGQVGQIFGKEIGGDLGGAIGKAAGMILGTTAGTKKNLNALKDDLYAKESGLAKGLVGNASKLDRGLNSIIEDITPGANATVKSLGEKILGKITKKPTQTVNTGILNAKGNPITRVQRGHAPKLPVEDALSSLREVNAQLGKYGTKSPEGRSLIRMNHELNEYIKGTARSIGTQPSLEFLRNFEKSQDLYRGFEGLESVGRAIKNSVDLEDVKSPIVKSMIKGFGFTVGKGLSWTGIGKAASLGFGAKNLYRLGYLFQNSKTANEEYKRILKFAAQGATKQLAAAIGRLDKIATKWEEDNPESFEIL